MLNCDFLFVNLSPHRIIISRTLIKPGMKSRCSEYACCVNERALLSFALIFAFNRNASLLITTFASISSENSAVLKLQRDLRDRKFRSVEVK